MCECLYVCKYVISGLGEISYSTQPTFNKHVVCLWVCVEYRRICVFMLLLSALATEIESSSVPS